MAEAMSDPDDDIVIIDEATAEQDLVAKLPSLEAITEAVDQAKLCVDMTEKEIALIQEDLKRSENDLGKEVFDSLKMFLEDPSQQATCALTEDELDKMITEILESIPPEEFDLSAKEAAVLEHRLTLLEKTNHSISKVFLDCHTQLKEFRQLQMDITESLEKKLATCSDKPIFIDDVDADITSDEKIIQSTYIVKERSKGQKSPVPSALPPSPSNPSPGKVQPQPQPESPANKRPSVVFPTMARQIQAESWALGQPHLAFPAPNVALPGHQQQRMPGLDTLHSNFANTVTPSMPNLVSTLQQQAQLRHNLSSYAIQEPRPALAFQLQRPALLQQTILWPDLKVGDKVLGKKFNDVWYSGTIINIAAEEPSLDQEWRCRVKFDGKGAKWLPGRQVAYRDPINCFIRVGTRIVALYREDDAPSTFYAGVIAEAPSSKNNRRFLVFFDDGYAQYCEAKELHKVYIQSSNVWEDINPETSAFIKEYLRIYPERPMVRLSKGQVVRTEWNGKWWTSKVVETDASLVKMYFQADKRTEWIYRGSTRLEPLFKALANANAIKAAGSAKGRRHNLNTRPMGNQQKPSVEYTRGIGDEDTSSNASTSGQSNSKSTTSASSKAGTADAKSASPSTSTVSAPPKKKHNVARKSTTSASSSLQHKGSLSNASPSSTAAAEKNAQRGTGKTSKYPEAAVQERPIASTNKVEYDGSLTTGERRNVKIELKPRQPFSPHTCCKDCLQGVIDDPTKMKGRNALLIPLLYGWERQLCKARPAAKRLVTYRAPCGRRLRNIKETDTYLFRTDSLLTIDLFSFDQHLHVNTEFVPIKTFCDIKDLSYGRENYPISCVNGVDRHYPDYVEYSDHRIPSKKVNLNTDPDFLVCCDCTDNCRDRSKCACQQLTIENTSWIGDKDPHAGYHHRRLKEPLFTGIVECNSRCKCDKRCANRVAQHGLSMRLQVFKTGKKGWGLRCLDDIAKGSFICIYAGQLLTDREANEDGKQYGDQYLAELDFIEVVERQKEGYESDVEPIDFSDDDKDANYKASKESEDDSDYGYQGSLPENSERSLRRRKKDEETAAKEISGKSEKPARDSTETNKSSSEQQPTVISDDEDDDDTKNSSTAEEEVKTDKPENSKSLRPRAKKSTGGSRLNPSIAMKPSQESIAEKEIEKKKERKPTRDFFNDDTECYIMDAKSMGNLGRYLNHSCDPNVFVQNIFVDTHDLRFPWVTFWAGQYIRAGTELTWDYNYEVDSVPDRVLYCYCNSAICRGRLL